MRLPSRAQCKAATAWLSMTSNIAVILVLFLLDVRDLNYKLAWIGPTESFSFITGSVSILHPEPLCVSAARDLRLRNASSQSFKPMDSGWPSFLARCEKLYAMGADGSSFFLSAMGTDCVLGEDQAGTVHLASRLVMTSDQRVDALVWASCLLLHISRRPPVCHEPLVSEFYRRYMFQESSLPPRLALAPKDSSAEKELLRFLDMVSESVPQHRIVCVEAFRLNSSFEFQEYEPTIFGCGSPSSFRSEFVGIENPGIVDLVKAKAWLTADSISVMSSRFLIRQNCHSSYRVRTRAHDGALVLESHTATNFSSFGHLYVLLILIDVTLLTLNCLSSLELVGRMSFPKFADVKKWVEQKEAAEKMRRALQSKAAERQRSGPPATLETKRSFIAVRVPSISNLLANHVSGTVAPTVSEDAASPPQKKWTRRSRRLLATMEAMSGTAGIEEEQLYSFFSRSLYRNPRIAAITAATQLISWLVVLPNAVVWTWSNSAHEKLQAYMSSIRCWVLILVMCNTIWAGVTRISERAAYNVTKRTFITSIDVVCIGALITFAQRRYIFAMSEAKWSLEKQRVNDVTSFDGGFLAHGNTFNVALDSIHTTPWTILTILYKPLVRILITSIGAIATVLAIKAVYFSRQRRLAYQTLKKSVSRFSNRMSSVGRNPKAAPTEVSDDDENERLQNLRVLEETLSRPYQRLPLEEWLDQPIRAASLIRNGLRMETIRDQTRFIRPSCYLDFGIIVKQGVIHSRVGFSEALKTQMSVQDYMTRVEHLAPPSDIPLDSSEPIATLNPGRYTSSSRLAKPPLRSSGSIGPQRKQSLHVPLS